MKETEEIKENILEFYSKEDAKEFETLAKGRKFCKRGQRIKDICKEEIARKDYNKLGLLSKIFHKKEFKRKKEFLLENRLTSNVRVIAMYLLNQDENINVEQLEEKTKEFILKKVEEYKAKE